jgi:hypothetical protein
LVIEEVFVEEVFVIEGLSEDRWYSSIAKTKFSSSLVNEERLLSLGLISS